MTAVGLFTSGAIASSDFYTIDTDVKLFSEGRYIYKAYDVALTTGTVSRNYGTGGSATYYYVSDGAFWRANNPPADPSTVYSVTYKPDNTAYSITADTNSITTSVNGSSIKKRVFVQAAKVNSVSSAFLGGVLDVGLDEGLGFSTIYVGTSGRIEDLKTSFVSNSITSNLSNTDGPLIQVTSASLGTVQADIIANQHTFNGSRMFGGFVSISNQSTVDSISNTTFHSNLLRTSSGEIYGGMFSNRGVITEYKNSGFLYNIIESSQNVRGGMLYNANSIETLSNVDFIGNEIKVSGTGGAYGGGIYNIGVIDLVDTSFVGNVLTVTGSGLAQGAAIYTTSSMSITAKDKDVVFQDNELYVNNVVTYEDIYVANRGAVLTLNANAGRTILFGGNINGVTGYGLSLLGSGSIAFWGNITGARFNVDPASSLTLDFANNEMQTYTFALMNSSANAKYYLDIDFSTNKSDKFVVTQGDRKSVV